MNWTRFWEQPRKSQRDGWVVEQDDNQPRPFRTGEREGWSRSWICKRLAWVAGVHYLVLFAFLLDKAIDNAVPNGRHPIWFTLQKSFEVMCGAGHPRYLQMTDFHVSMLILQGFAVGIGIAVYWRRSPWARTVGYLSISIHFLLGILAIALPGS